METRETSVSLLLMTWLKITPDGPVELVAVLQRRGDFNHETMAPESWPGACQLTVHGKIGPAEDDRHALYREAIEELSENFVGTEMAWRESTAQIEKVGRVNTTKKQAVFLLFSC